MPQQPQLSPLQAMIFLGAVVLLLVVLIIIAARGRSRGPMYCPSCGTTAKPKCRYQGSDAMSLFLLLFFFPVGIIYELWRGSAPQWVCPSCERGGMLPRAAATKPHHLQ